MYVCIHLPIVKTRSSAYRRQFRVEPFGSNPVFFVCLLDLLTFDLGLNLKQSK